VFHPQTALPAGPRPHNLTSHTVPVSTPTCADRRATPTSPPQHCAAAIARPRDSTGRPPLSPRPTRPRTRPTTAERTRDGHCSATIESAPARPLSATAVLRQPLALLQDWTDAAKHFRDRESNGLRHRERRQLEAGECICERLLDIPLAAPAALGWNQDRGPREKRTARRSNDPEPAIRT
jgi:hypothetical protein